MELKKLIPQTNTEKLFSAFVESAKLVLRLYVLSLVPIVITLGNFILKGIDMTNYTINVDWEIAFNMVKVQFIFYTITFILAGVDKFKHKYLKALNPEELEGKSAGLVKF